MHGREKLKYKMLDKGGYQGETKAYIKEEADSVMDAHERRIARLAKCVEMWHKVNEDLQSNNTHLRKRVKELEAAISKMETTTPKWVSVNDRLPERNPMLPALTEEGYKTWWGNWHDGNLEIYGIAYWLDNAFPPPPTT